MKERMKKNWLIILLIIVIIFLMAGGFFLYNERNQTNKILVKRLQVLQEYIQGYIEFGEPPFFEIKEQKDKNTTPPFTGTEFIPTGITTKHIKKAYSIKSSEDEWEVMFELNEIGTELFADLTQRNIGNSIGIYLEGVPISLPIVIEEIEGGKMSLTKFEGITKEEIENFILHIQDKVAGNTF